MSQYGNYPNPNCKDWYCQLQINKINKVIELKKHIFFLLATCLCLCILSVILFKENKNQENRLNEHKRLLIAQQEQINKLILNAHKYEKKVK